MKKKLTVNTLALGNLKQRKKQYTIMIIGIIMAMVFSSGIIFYLFSYNETMAEKARNEIGDQAGIVYIKNSDDKFYQEMINEGLIEDYGYSHIIGYGYTADDEEIMGCAVAWLDDKAKEISYQSFIEGSYPVNADEIAVEKTALARLGNYNAKIGDTIKLKLMVQNDNELMEAVEKSYTLTGIVTDKKYTMTQYSGVTGKNTLIPAAFVAQGTNTEPGGREKLCAYIQNEEKDFEWEGNLNKYLNDIKKVTCEIECANTERKTNMSVIYSDGIFAVFLAAVLSLTSCVAIVNSFNTNLKERKKQIGMMRAVGATKRQIINIFAREALIIALICTPISIAVSYAAVRLVLSLLNVEVVITHSILVLPVCAVIGIAVVMIAAFIPLISASRITPIQSIRDISSNRKMKTKKIKTQKQFSVSSLLAKRNLTFFRGGRTAVSIMLMTSIIFSCWGFSYINNIKKSTFSYNYDYIISGLESFSSDGINYSDEKTGMTESDKQEIQSVPYISEIREKKRISALINIEKYTDYYKAQNMGWAFCFTEGSTGIYELNADNYYENMLTKYSEEYLELKSLIKSESELFPTEIISYNSEFVKAIDSSIIQGSIDINKLNSGEEIILIAPKEVSLGVEFDKNGGWSSSAIFEDDNPENYEIVASGSSDYSVGDTIDIDVVTYKDQESYINNPDAEFEQNHKQVKIGAIISPNVLRNKTDIESYSGLWVMTTTQGMNSFYKNAKYTALDMNCDTTITEDIDKQITEAVTPYLDKYDGYMNSNFAMQQRQENEIKILIVSMLSLIIIAFSICASIINNSLTARIRENKKELGTLRAFGADISELVKSYVKQLLAMFVWGVGLGFGGFSLIYIIVYFVKKSKKLEMFMTFSPWVTIVFCTILFAVCSVNLWVKIKKEMKNSIIENIREL